MDKELLEAAKLARAWLRMEAGRLVSEADNTLLLQYGRYGPERHHIITRLEEAIDLTEARETIKKFDAETTDVFGVANEG